MVPLTPSVCLPGICCSTAHITLEDSLILALAATECGHYDWIHDTGYGYLLRLNARYHPALRLKAIGLSGACRRLVVTLMQRYGIHILHLDADGDLLPDFATFDW
ncbi:TPA: hypothetical protein M4731_000948 [Salmonella enterica]|nr:hypothetical protein [Salmonella enterica]HCC3864104.1 hypothetical protein [Salmonella enterica]HCC3879615.1 hypothetical protein [Salmonella enterica]HCC3965138.1 hypothetical protein [Salmonella enterica]HCC4014904.1 hypothetical protein [Salmonella enterica]